MNKIRFRLIKSSTNGLIEQSNGGLGCFERVLLHLAANKVISLHKYCYDLLHLKPEKRNFLKSFGGKKKEIAPLTEERRLIIQDIYNFLTNILGGAEPTFTKVGNAYNVEQTPLLSWGNIINEIEKEF